MNSPLNPQRVRWSDSIACDLAGDTLWISGRLLNPPVADLMRAYETEDPSPHVAFANSVTDDELIAFTKRYGPVIASAAAWGVPEPVSADAYWDHQLEQEQEDRIE